ncbi:hypothetical protein [Streptomyces sp. NPDC006784]|uniref:hypothetical protein n=1 Tax=Streptomyces sp. NPDC006784 TaxID=3364764 RepID=UPI003690D537
MSEANSPSSPSPSARVRTEDRAPADGRDRADDRDPASADPGSGERPATEGPAATEQDGGSSPTGPAGEARRDGPPEAQEPGEPEGTTVERPALTPRQARRIRIALSAVVMLAVAVALAVRLRSAPSVLTVGFYGLALILSGTAIVLSRRGRTRVATAVLGLGFVLVVFGEWLLGASGSP